MSHEHAHRQRGAQAPFGRIARVSTGGKSSRALAGAVFAPSKKLPKSVRMTSRRTTVIFEHPFLCFRLPRDRNECREAQFAVTPLLRDNEAFVSRFVSGRRRKKGSV